MLIEIGNSESIKRLVGRNLIKLCKAFITATTTTTTTKRVEAE